MGRIVCVAISAAAGILGCAYLESTIARQPEQVVTADGLLKVEEDEPGVLFVKPDHYMGGYDAFLMDPVVIRYKRGEPPLDERDEERMKRYLHDALAQGIEDSHIEIAEEPGPCVVRIGVALIDLDLIEVSPVGGATTRIVRSLGTATLMNEYRDSLSGEALIRFATRRSIEGGLYTEAGRGLDWRRIRETFDQMMEDLTRNVIRSTPGLADAPPRPGCRGVLARVAAETLAARGP